MLKAHVEIYEERGKQLSSARRLMELDREYNSALALVSVHSGIAFNDALLAQLDKSSLGNDDHAKAVNLTKRACRARKLDQAGLKHLQTLLSAKTEISYSATRLTDEKAQALSVAAQRFEAWFYKTMGSLR